MYRTLLFVLSMGCLLSLTAQPRPPAQPVRSDFPSVLPAGAQHLGDQINTEYEESNPVISADNKYLYFVRRQAPQNLGDTNAGDIWRSKRLSDVRWSRPVNLGAPLNNRFHNEPVAITPGDNLIYLSNQDDDSSIGPAYSRRSGRSWSAPQNCRIQDYYTRGDGATFHVGGRGRVMIMALDRPEGFGRQDLYVSLRQADQSWSRPINLGPVINTVQDEKRAFLAADGQTLYFASRGHGGQGGLDLFYSSRLDDSWTNWSAPVNLGGQINTAADDEYISLPAQGNPAYVVYRDTAQNANIYTVNLPPALRPQPVTLFKGRITADKPIQGFEQAALVDLDPNAGSVPTPLVIAQDGTFTVIIPPDDALGIQVRAPEYLPICVSLMQTVAAEEDTEVDVSMLTDLPLSNAYQDREAKISELRPRLEALDLELAKLQRRRSAQLALPKRIRTKPPVIYSDPVMDALRHRYLYHLRNAQDTIPKPADKDWQEKNSAIPEKDARRGVADDELAEMKKRYRKFYQPKAEPEETEQYLWDEAKSFADFEESVRRDMRKEMAPLIGDRLASELWPQVRASLEDQAPPSDLALLDERELEIREQIAQRLTEARSYNQEEKPLRPGWQLSLEAELRQALRDDVEKELERELREDVRQALTQEARYHLSRQEYKTLQQQMQELVTQQIEEERMLLPVHPKEEEWQSKGQIPTEYREMEREITLIPARPGAVLRLENVAFSPNSARLKPTSFIELDELAAYLIAKPDIRVEIAAHTNGWLSHALSQQLSEERAKAVADYLMGKGVAGRQLQARGYGKTQPVASNDTVEGRRKNQRIEVQILEE